MAAYLRLSPSLHASARSSNRRLPLPLESENCVRFRHFASSPPPVLNLHAQRASAFVIRAAAGDPVNVDHATVEENLLPSGEWPENFSMLNFEDLSKHYEPFLFKAEVQPSTFLADVMSRTIYTARPYQLLEEVDHFFMEISGLPVVNDELKCIGVFSKKYKSRAPYGMKSRVDEVMSSPPITLCADKTVLDAAVLMLKNKIHRIPIVNESNQVVGIVTRTDIFSALEGAS